MIIAQTENNKRYNIAKQYPPIINVTNFRKAYDNPYCDSFPHILQHYRKQTKIIKFTKLYFKVELLQLNWRQTSAKGLIQLLVSNWECNRFSCLSLPLFHYDEKLWTGSTEIFHGLSANGRFVRAGETAVLNDRSNMQATLQDCSTSQINQVKYYEK